MTRPILVFVSLVAGLLIGGPAKTQAGPVTWTFITGATTINPPPADGSYGDYFYDTTKQMPINIGVQRFDPSYIVAGSATVGAWGLQTLVALPAKGIFTYTASDSAYDLYIGLSSTDDTALAGASFSGYLTGTLGINQDALVNHFTTPTTQTGTFGGLPYAITVTYKDMGFQTSHSPSGTFTNWYADIDAEVTFAPEPSSLVLTGIGLISVGGAGWRRWRCGRTSTAKV